MTEEEWLACEDPEQMLNSLRVAPSVRKLRLFACECCRRIWPLLGDDRSRVAVGVAERHADGRADDEQLADASALAEEAFHAIPWDSRGMPNGVKLAASTVWAATATELEETVFKPVVGFAINTALQAGDAVDQRQEERAAQAQLLRDIFGNPFRPATFDPAWRTGTAVALAKQMYESRDFGAMPILADALQDAGCDSEDVLNHCRSGGVHVRGCWVVDLVLGRE